MTTANQSRHGRHVDDAQGQHHGLQAAAEGGHHQHRQQQSREGQQGVERPHDGRFAFAAVVAGDEAQRHADDTAHDHHHERAQQCRGSAIDDAGQDVTTGLVGAQRVRSAGTQQQVGEFLGDGVGGGQQPGRQRGDEQRDEHDQRDQRGSVANQ